MARIKCGAATADERFACWDGGVSVIGLGGEPEDFAATIRFKYGNGDGIVEHTFTHFHLELVVWRAQKKTPALNGRFVAFAELEHEALPSLMRKVAAHALKPIKAK